jgi:hypothetical protein
MVCRGEKGKWNICLPTVPTNCGDVGRPANQFQKQLIWIHGQASAMTETKKSAESQSATEQAELLEKERVPEVQDQASAMPEISETSRSQSATEQAEPTEKEHTHVISNLYLPSGLIDDVGSHVQSINE